MTRWRKPLATHPCLVTTYTGHFLDSQQSSVMTEAEGSSIKDCTGTSHPAQKGCPDAGPGNWYFLQP